MTEALPTALIEAAACGLPVVATPVGGTPEVVEHGRTGLLVPPGDVDGLAVAVVELLSSPARRAAFGTAARAVAEERFDVARWALALRSLYEEALSRDSSAPGPAPGR
jgi:glycosyltransferase involved in cell wall biosynthesis